MRISQPPTPQRRRAVARQLQAKLAEWRALQRRVESAQIWLEGRIAFSQGAQKADFELRKREIDDQAQEAKRRIAEADADIAALADPSCDASGWRAVL